MCNFIVGGIHTVLRTKARISVDEMGDQYCMIGPYIEKSVQLEVEVIEPVASEPMMKAIQAVRNYGFHVSLICE